MVSMITQAELHKALDYAPDTGVFRWKHRPDMPVRWNTRWAGKAAGGMQENGYWRIAIHDSRHLAHRLAWLYVHGDWPSHYLDHINLDRLDNRIANLREADDAQNSANISTRENTRSGYRGVWFRSQRNVWCAQIHFRGRKQHLGSFKNKEDAAAAYAKAARRLYGEFCPDHLKVA
jgi:hypothetical protein